MPASSPIIWRATLGKTLIVESKPGANGNIAAQFVVDAPADGSVIWVGTQSMVEINPSAYKSLRWKPADFIPVIKGIESPLMLSTHPSVPAKTLAELVAWVKANPKKLSYASYSAGTPSHFLGFQMNERFGLDLAHVPYRGGAPQVTDLVAGHALLGFTQVQGALEHVRAGRLNAILTTGAQRARAVPDLPTFAELGHPDLTAAIWFGLLMKTGTPPDARQPHRGGRQGGACRCRRARAARGAGLRGERAHRAEPSRPASRRSSSAGPRS